MRIWFDTESIRFLGATMLFQYQREKDKDVTIHNIFDEPITKTLDLIEEFSENTIVGYNLSHEGYHFARTYNCLSLLDKNRPLVPEEYAEVEKTIESKQLCIRPKGGCVDLLLIGRRNKFQSTLKQHPIRIRRVPRILAEKLISHLNKIDINPIYFAKLKKGRDWVIKDIDAENGKELSDVDRALGRVADKDLVNVVLKFAPSAKLKDIVKHILKIDDAEDFNLPGNDYGELGWNPASGEWIKVYGEHKFLWTLPSKLEYAKKDVIYTRMVDEYLDYPDPDYVSELAFLTGQVYWSGYGIDVDEAKRQYAKKKSAHKRRIKRLRAIAPKLNPRSPVQLIKYLHSVATPLEKIAITSTNREVMKALCECENHKLAYFARLLTTSRNIGYELKLLERLIEVGRFHITLNMHGTWTGRATGSDAVNSQKEKINPQGIKKSDIRKIFTFRDPWEETSGGDFSGFEVSIFEAVYKDPDLRKELLSGKKIHAIWGSFLYNRTYDEVLATDGIKATEPDGIYQRSKNSFFASLYFAQDEKIAEVTWLDVEVVAKAHQNFKTKYKKVGEAENQLKIDHVCLAQEKIGASVKWREPKTYVESFLGLKRGFDFEYSMIKEIFNLALDLPEDLKGKDVYVLRRDRPQKAENALMSALYGACYNMANKIVRIAGNFKIQSGAEITKMLQSEIYSLQPLGIHPFNVKVFNMHDEVRVSHPPELREVVAKTVKDFVDSKKSLIPLLEMEWESNVKSWHKEKKSKLTSLVKGAYE